MLKGFSYSTSIFRMVLIGVVLVGAFFMLGNPAGAQGTPAATPAPTAVPAAASPSGFSYTSLIPNDPVTYLIGSLSFVAVTLIVQGFIKTRAAVFIPPTSVATIESLIANRQMKELIDFTEVDDSFISKALNPALKRAPSFNAMKEALETSVGEQTANSFRKIEYLNIIGNLGPLLGLLGTVLGMIQAFAAMQRAGGQANPADLSGGIATALAHTFLGLALAIPCLATFGILRTLTDRLCVEGALKAEELLLQTKPPEGKPGPGAPVSPPATPAPAAVLPVGVPVSPAMRAPLPSTPIPPPPSLGR